MADHYQVFDNTFQAFGESVRVSTNKTVYADGDYLFETCIFWPNISWDIETYREYPEAEEGHLHYMQAVMSGELKAPTKGRGMYNV